MQGVYNKAIDNRKNHGRVNRNVESLPGEIWKDILEWRGYELQEGYQVSNLGRVRNLGRTLEQIGRNGKVVKHPYPPCMLRLTHDPDGYLFVGLSGVGRKVVDARIHQLVATFFLEQQPRPDQTHVNHKDGNKENNLPSNLEWASPDENNKHARDNGLARLGTSQAIRCKVVEWDKTYSSRTQMNIALGRKSGYLEYCLAHNKPIVDINTGQIIHIEFIYPEGGDKDERKTGT